METKHQSYLSLMACGAIALMVGLIAGPVQVTTAESPLEVEMQASTDGIVMQFSVSSSREVLSFSVRVVGPEQFVFEERIQGKSLQWIPPDYLPDGWYNWETLVVSVDQTALMRELTPALQKLPPDHWFDQETKQTHLASGSFQVESGMLVLNDQDQQDEGESSLTRRIASAILDFLIPSAHAQSGSFDNSVTIMRDTNGPWIALLDPDQSGDFPLWRIEMTDTAQKNLRIRYCETTIFGCVSGSEIFPMTIHRSNGNVGIGTVGTPSSRLWVDGEVGQNPLSASINGLIRFRVNSNGGVSVGSQAAAPSNGLYVLGNSGFGTTAPAAPIHVRRTNGSALVLVEETSSGDDTLFELRNNGHSRFIFRDTSTSNIWEFRTAGSGSAERFQINRLGSGELEFQVRRGGDAFFAGDVTANGVLLTSTREAKTDFAPLDVNDVLARLSSLEISKWRYKHEDEGTVHFGPVAEEFHEIFGLSDGKHLNMIDTNGITFAAIQALDKRNQQLNQENQQIKAENESLAQRLERIENELKLF